MKILLDMNLSPLWIDIFETRGWEAVHWSTVGDPRASDREIMDWACTHQHIVFTHDLDFGTLLALTHASGPSVVQVRTQGVLPKHIQDMVIAAITQFEEQLSRGVLMVIDTYKVRVRMLPLFYKT